MKNDSSLLELTVAGSPHEIGYQHGRQAQHLIRVLYEYRLGNIAIVTHETEQQILSRAAVFVDPVKEYLPDLLEEVRGLAAGAELSFEQAFFLQCATEVSLGAGCSAVGIASLAEPLVAQNWDQPHDSRGKQTITHFLPEGHHEILMFGHAGAIGYIGMNAKGLGHVGNQLYRRENENGIPHYFINRQLLNFETVAQAVEWLESVPVASTVNYIIGDASGKLIDIELGGGHSHKLQRGSVELHTNHYLTAKFRQSDQYRETLPDSLPRLLRLQNMSSGQPSMSEADVAEMLRDHTNYPFSICRHEDNGLVTTASVIMRLRAREMLIAYGPPCTTDYASYRMIQ